MGFPTHKEIEAEEIITKVHGVVIDAAWEGCFTRDEIIQIIKDAVDDVAVEELNEDGTFKSQEGQ